MSIHTPIVLNPHMREMWKLVAEYMDTVSRGGIGYSTRVLQHSNKVECRVRMRDSTNVVLISISISIILG